MDRSVFDSHAYRRSRGAYRAQCTFEYLITILMSDSYLAKLLSDIGVGDTFIGIISSFIAAAFLFQLAAIFLAPRIKNVKRAAIIFHVTSQVIFASLYFVPTLPFPGGVKTFIVVSGILIAYSFRYTVLSIIYRWANSFVDPEKRGVYSAGKEMISLIIGIVFSLSIGMLIDGFEAAGNLRGGFLVVAVIGLIISGLDLVTLSLIENRAEPENASKIPVRKVISGLIGNRGFRSVVILNVLWQSACYLTIGFLGIYKIRDLALTVGAVQMINILGNFCRFLVSRGFGRYSDRTSYARGIGLAMMIAAAAFFVNVFTTPKTWYLIIVYTILYSACLAGTEQNFSNIVYSYVPETSFVQANAIKNSIGGIFGFISSLVGSRILGAVQANGNTIFGVTVYGQQILSLISLILIVAAMIYNRAVISKRSVMGQ